MLHWELTQPRGVQSVQNFCHAIVYFPSLGIVNLKYCVQSLFYDTECGQSGKLDTSPLHHNLEMLVHVW